MTDYAALEKRLAWFIDELAGWESHGQLRSALVESRDALASLTRELEEAREVLIPFATAAQGYSSFDFEGEDIAERAGIPVRALWDASALVQRLSREGSD